MRKPPPRPLLFPAADERDRPLDEIETAVLKAFVSVLIRAIDDDLAATRRPRRRPRAAEDEG